MLLYALCTATTQVYCSYDVFFVARFVFLSEWNEVICVCVYTLLHCSRPCFGCLLFHQGRQSQLLC
jgi:hypothetical protein